MHLHKNEENLGYLHPLGWGSLRQQLTALFLDCCRRELRLGCCGCPLFFLVREDGAVLFFLFFYFCFIFNFFFFFCVCILTLVILIFDSCNCFLYCYFYLKKKETVNYDTEKIYKKPPKKQTNKNGMNVVNFINIYTNIYTYITCDKDD